MAGLPFDAWAAAYAGHPAQARWDHGPSSVGPNAPRAHARGGTPACYGRQGPALGPTGPTPSVAGGLVPVPAGGSWPANPPGRCARRWEVDALGLGSKVCGALASFSTKRDAAGSRRRAPQAAGHAAVGGWRRPCARATQRLVRRPAPRAASAHALTASWVHAGRCCLPAAVGNRFLWERLAGRAGLSIPQESLKEKLWVTGSVPEGGGKKALTLGYVYCPPWQSSDGVVHRVAGSQHFRFQGERIAQIEGAF